jgi:hypothetical protein
MRVGAWKHTGRPEFPTRPHFEDPSPCAATVSSIITPSYRFLDRTICKTSGATKDNPDTFTFRSESTSNAANATIKPTNPLCCVLRSQPFPQSSPSSVVLHLPERSRESCYLARPLPGYGQELGRKRSGSELKVKSYPIKKKVGLQLFLPLSTHPLLGSEGGDQPYMVFGPSRRRLEAWVPASSRLKLTAPSWESALWLHLGPQTAQDTLEGAQI